MRMTRPIASRELLSFRRTGFGPFLATAYLILTGTLWVYALHTHEGEVITPLALWVQLHATLLPLLAMFATLRTFAAERAQGTLEVLQASPAPSSGIVMGKYFAALVVTWGILALAALGPFMMLPNVVAGAGAEVSFIALLAGFLMLALQAAFWTALGILLSVVLRSQALVATSALLLAGVLPHGLRFFNVALLFPLVHPQPVALDAMDGVLSFFPVACYAAPTPALLFVAARVFDLHLFKTR